MQTLELCTSKELGLVTDINGYNEQALDDIVYSRTGFNSLDQYLEAYPVFKSIANRKITNKQ
jgi:hypothetical protein